MRLKSENTLFLQLISQTSGSVKFLRKNKILTIKTAHSSVKIHNETVAIDPLLLFQRTSTNFSDKDYI